MMAGRQAFSWTCAILALAIQGIVFAIHEDQAGQFDWHWKGVGPPVWAKAVHSSSGIAVATSADVIAVLESNTGEIAWRQVLDDRGGLGAILLARSERESIFAVSADGSAVRSFRVATGLLEWEREAPLPVKDADCPPPSMSEGPEAGSASGSVVVAHCGDLRTYSAGDGKLIGSMDLGQHIGARAAVHAVNREGGRVTALVSRVEGGASQVAVLTWDGLSSQDVQVYRWDSATPHMGIRAAATKEGFAFVTSGGNAVAVQAASAEEGVRVAWTSNSPIRGVQEMGDGSGAVSVLTEDASMLLSPEGGQGLRPVAAAPKGAFARKDGTEWAVAAAAVSFTLGEAGRPSTVMLGPDVLSIPGDVAPSEAPHSIRLLAAIPGGFLLVSGDGHVSAVEPSGALLWHRPEWRATVPRDVAPLMVDLPTVHGKAASVATMSAADWLRLQILDVKGMFAKLSPSEKMAASALKESLSTKNLPTADSNGFRMGIVVPAERGVLAALHNGDGRTLWAVRVGEQCTPAALKHVSMPRSAFSGGRHSSEDAKESVVVALLRCGADRWSSVAVHAHSGEVIARNDASGRLVKVVAPAEGEGIGAVVADGRGALAISVVPASVREGFLEAFAERMYVWVPEDRGISGYRMERDSRLSHSWSVSLPGPIETIAARDPTEPVYSRTRRTLQGTIGFKYLNPNALLVASTYPPTPAAPGGLEARVIDTVTGRTLAALKTPSASGPVSAVFGEHWAAYSYWSGVNGRAEIGSIELGDGSGPKVGFWDAVVGTLDNPEPYSSFDGGRVLVAAQTYFGPKSLAGMGVTRTRNGIASKAVLMCLESGGVLMVDQRVLDPRLERLDARKMSKVEIDARRKELAAKKIPVGTEHITERMGQLLTHRHVVASIRGVTAAPTLLESTTGVVAWGTDLFYTRAFPSQHFDGISDGFSYLAVGLSIVAMVILLLWLRRAAVRNQIKQKWE